MSDDSDEFPWLDVEFHIAQNRMGSESFGHVSDVDFDAAGRAHNAIDLDASFLDCHCASARVAAKEGCQARQRFSSQAVAESASFPSDA